jgi:hypothetical protein
MHAPVVSERSLLPLCVLQETSQVSLSGSTHHLKPRLKPKLPGRAGQPKRDRGLPNATQIGEISGENNAHGDGWNEMGIMPAAVLLEE